MRSTCTYLLPYFISLIVIDGTCLLTKIKGYKETGLLELTEVIKKTISTLGKKICDLQIIISNPNIFGFSVGRKIHILVGLTKIFKSWNK